MTELTGGQPAWQRDPAHTPGIQLRCHRVFPEGQGPHPNRPNTSLGWGSPAATGLLEHGGLSTVAYWQQSEKQSARVESKRPTAEPPATRITLQREKPSLSTRHRDIQQWSNDGQAWKGTGQRDPSVQEKKQSIDRTGDGPGAGLDKDTEAAFINGFSRWEQTLVSASGQTRNRGEELGTIKRTEMKTLRLQNTPTKYPPGQV